MQTGRDGTSRTYTPGEAIEAGITTRSFRWDLYCTSCIKVIIYAWYDSSGYKEMKVYPRDLVDERGLLTPGTFYPMNAYTSFYNRSGMISYVSYLSGFIHGGLTLYDEVTITIGTLYCGKPVSNHEKCGRFEGHPGECLSVDSLECIM